jgi:flagellar motility protein MotE (MotC chaperone)
MVGVIGGAFYIVIHNNVNGLGERYRTNLQGLPLVKLALPAVADPTDPKYLTDDEIKKGYQELRKKNAELTKQLEEAKKNETELQKYKDDQDKTKAEDEKIKKDAEDQKAQIEAQKKQLDEDQKKVNELIASGDKAGFQAFFQKVDKDTASKIYTEIMKEQKASADATTFSQIYQTMDASAAAKIFEAMGDSKIDLVVEILKNMKKENTAAIIAAMTPDFSSTVTEKLSQAYMGDTTKAQ